MKNNQLINRIFSNWPVKILALAGAVILFFFNNINKLEERYLSVPLRIELDDEFVPGENYTERVRVRIRGDGEGIFRILEEDLLARANFTQYQSEGIFKAPVEIELSGTAQTVEPLEIEVEPESVTLELEEKVQKSLEVVPNITGNPAAGYNLARYYLNPSAVEATGPRSRLNNIAQVRTEEIDLTGRRSDFSVRVRILPPNELISFPGGNVIEFRGIIEETLVFREITGVDVAVVDLDPAYRIAGEIQNGTLQIQGSQEAMEAVSAGDIIMTVDASQINETGTYTLEIDPIIPDEVTVLDYQPKNIELTVEPGEDNQ
ncbi:MAG: YbbR-like domain-containing protein [Spirochaetia bacterium]